MKHYKIIGLSLSIVFFAIVLISGTQIPKHERLNQISYRTATNSTVCPPFHLYDEDGNLVDPVNGINAGNPYSPRQTCGKCHDYDLITEGYHFQQGKDEQAEGVYAERYQWVSHPGNYGGNWCSPAPLYRYLSPKENDSARTMDMTSFSFFAASCGGCHPGGGPGEYDRAGFRYDHFMAHMGYEAGGVNDFDGDYYQARWNETGVLEADCMICHQPEYGHNERKKQLGELNFRWAATAASGWAEVTGSVKSETPVLVSYDLSKFDKDGKLSPHIVREPRNSACLSCHAQPGWKKRGANYDPRTDVHLRAGMRCVDCHPAGSLALDERINQREMHQFGKGDDPGGQVRNDLNNTVISCNHCHNAGTLGAPYAEHAWLPPLHLEKIACQTCHIPERSVKPAQMQASDVFNPGTKITTSGKKLWVFYGPDMKYYNHYGNLEMMGFDDKPTDPFRPVLTLYNGMIYPVNRIHSAWPAIQVDGKPGLHQPKMNDIYQMWQDHFADPMNYPELSIITDDNGNGILEVNRPEEIDALIAAVTNMLNKTDYPMEGKRVVWAMNDRVYTSGTEFYILEKALWEASPYASVFKYSHDVYPARAALGSKGCVECHSLNSDFFYAQIVKYPFDLDGNPVYEPQYKILGMAPFYVWISAVREQHIKTILYPVIVLLVLLIIVSIARWVNDHVHFLKIDSKILYLAYAYLFIFTGLVYLKPDVYAAIMPERLWFDKNHFFITVFALLAGLFCWLRLKSESKALSVLGNLQLVFILTAIFSGIIIMIRFEGILSLVRIAFTVYDLVVLLSVFTTIVDLISREFDLLRIKQYDETDTLFVST